MVTGAVEPASVNEFLLRENIRINTNPAVSPDMTLDFDSLCTDLENEPKLLENFPAETVGTTVRIFPKSEFSVRGESFYLAESQRFGDCVLVTKGRQELPFKEVREILGVRVIPLYWGNFIILKNFVLENDPKSTIFPVAQGALESTSIGVGARFTTLHWPAVAWTMSQLGISLTANQNSIPRELVYDPDAMLKDMLSECPFPFIGRSVPEGHQGQSVHGMSHASVITYLKYGLHRRAIFWGFNADHQPIGGRFDAIENELVAGSLFASYITYDLSPELTQTQMAESVEDIETTFADTVDQNLFNRVSNRLAQMEIPIDATELKRLVTYLTPAMNKMKRRDELYTEIRNEHFTTSEGKRFFKELSIDELPGQTTPEILAVCLAMVEQLGVHFQYVAPNIGFQKNFPYEDNGELSAKIEKLYAIAEKFGVSFGFHSGSGKSAENYGVCGRATRKNFEVKTSGRYTYEMGVALSQSSNPEDRRLWEDWYTFTKELAVRGAFSENEIRRQFAREFITHALRTEKKDQSDVFQSEEALRTALSELSSSPDHMFWFEYNFLYVLAGGGSLDQLGDHTRAGYEQRQRFYTISEEGRLRFARRIAEYLIFLTESTGMVSAQKAGEARKKLAGYQAPEDMYADIA